MHDQKQISSYVWQVNIQWKALLNFANERNEIFSPRKQNTIRMYPYRSRRHVVGTNIYSTKGARKPHTSRTNAEWNSWTVRAYIFSDLTGIRSRKERRENTCRTSSLFSGTLKWFAAFFCGSLVCGEEGGESGEKEEKKSSKSIRSFV